MSRSLRVLLYTDSAAIGGAEISLGNLLRALPGEVDAVLAGTSPAVLDALMPPGRGSPAVLPATLRGHLRGFRAVRPDLVHVNRSTPWAAPAATAAGIALPGVRVVTVDQLPLRTTSAALLWRTRGLTLRVDAAVAVGAASARRVEDFYALGRGDVRSVPNGVPPVEPARHRPGDGTLVAGCLGRLDPMKGFDVAIRALAHTPGVRLVLFGAGPGGDAAELRALAGELGVAGRVEFRPWTADRAAAFAGMDVFVLPSRTEGFPLALVEALSAGVPAVASAVGGVPEALDEGRCGLLVPPGDPLALAAALVRLRDDPALRTRLAAAGRDRARSRYSAAAMAAAYLALWHEVVDRPPRRRLVVTTPRP